MLHNVSILGPVQAGERLGAVVFCVWFGFSCQALQLWVPSDGHHSCAPFAISPSIKAPVWLMVCLKVCRVTSCIINFLTYQWSSSLVAWVWDFCFAFILELVNFKKRLWFTGLSVWSLCVFNLIMLSIVILKLIVGVSGCLPLYVIPAQYVIYLSLNVNQDLARARVSTSF